MAMIDERPADVADRRIAGHREGDLITSSANRLAIGTIVERTTRYLLLLHLPEATARIRAEMLSSTRWRCCPPAYDSG